jgi:hypothetical protein
MSHHFPPFSTFFSILLGLPVFGYQGRKLFAGKNTLAKGFWFPLPSP